MEINSNTVFLFGAGFTKAVFPSAPLNKELLNTVISNGGKTLAKYKEKYRTDDIEKLLTHFDLEVIERKELQKERSLIHAEISSYFSTYRISAFKEDLPVFLETFAKSILRINDTIISLNYDCFLEGVLDHYDVWSPNGGYARVVNPLADSIPQNPKNIKLYKIHGSENFVESSVIGKNRNQTDINYNIDGSIYPKSGAHSHLGGGIIKPGPYIIAPSFIKTPHSQITAMMLELLDIVKVARCLVIIGCGMRLEDSFLWLMLTRFLNIFTDYRKKLIIVDPSAERIWTRVSNYWVGDICGFADVLIIPCGIESGIEPLFSATSEKTE
jgi:hypothetical protein